MGRTTQPERLRSHPRLGFLLSSEQGSQSLGLVLSLITNLLYSKGEVPGPILI